VRENWLQVRSDNELSVSGGLQWRMFVKNGEDVTWANHYLTIFYSSSKRSSRPKVNEKKVTRSAHEKNAKSINNLARKSGKIHRLEYMCMYKYGA
jgi:predicted O-linked N-acetylglucosamine transferase (SPINDLY family)